GIFGNNSVRGKRRLRLADNIKHRTPHATRISLNVIDAQRETVVAAAGRIGRGRVEHALDTRELVPASDNGSLNHLTRDEGLNVGAELREVFGLRTRRIVLYVRVDKGLRHRGVHGTRWRLPHENRITILPEMFAMRLPQRATTSVRRTRAQ